MAAGRVVGIAGDRIADWGSFHDLFAEAFEFPAWYGRNRSAWIDLMTYLDDDQDTTGVFVAPGETVTINLTGAKALRARHHELYDALIECVAFVNWRRIEIGGTAYLCLAFHE
jgi:RNAse (barnase) inhibitor barstar